MKNVLVTGVMGKSGKYFLQNLIDNADDLKMYKFRFSCRKKNHISDLVMGNLNYEFIEGDLKDEEYLNVLTQNIDIIFHIAGINLSVSLVKYGIESKVKRFVLVHTTGIYSKYKCAAQNYILIENKLEDLLRRGKSTLTILRPTMIYGNLEDNNMAVFIKIVDKLKILPVVNGAQYYLQPVWAKDLGMAYYNVLMNEATTRNKNYNLSGGNEIMLIDILKIIAEQLGRGKIYFFSVPYLLAYFIAWNIYIYTLGHFDFREKVQRLVEDRVFDFEDARRDFGYSPTVFEVGIREEIEMYIENKRKDEAR